MKPFQIVEKLSLPGFMLLFLLAIAGCNNQHSSENKAVKVDTSQMKSKTADTGVSAVAVGKPDTMDTATAKDTNKVATTAEKGKHGPQKQQIKKNNTQIAFYQKWWFSLLLILLLSPLIYNFLNRKELAVSKELETVKRSEEELKEKLNEQQELYSKKEEEFSHKMKEEERLKFQAVGLSKFAELMSSSTSDLKLLGQRLIFELVEYVGAQSGLIYTMNSSSEDDPYLEVLSSYATDIEHIKELIRPGEGYVGTCYKEKQTIELKDIPQSYFKITSGLGKALPKYIAFVPLIQDKEVLGVIELASFAEIEDYKIEFIEKLSQNLASTLAIQYATERMQVMLERSKEQSEELRAQEEELRQNLEEMHATQEDLNRQIAENKKVQAELAKEQYLMDALMSNVPDYIYFKDLESKFIKSSTSLARNFGLDKAQEIVGRSDFDFFDDEHAKPAYEGEQEIIKTGKPIIDLVEKEVKKDGTITWASTTKLPLRDQDGNIIGTFGISKDVTEQKKMEMDIVEKNEALQAQEEELRQNLEEMQTTQEDLQQQIAENKKVQKELAKEQYLMDALMSNVPDHIYFKDLESKFIKTSTSQARSFGLDSTEEMVGKSDFDFFDDEHAKPAYEGEQEIIKTGKPIINLVEKEVKKDGTVTWASTTKLPLRDQDGNIIGTFGISKNVTEQKKMEIDIVEKNEALQAQEEELRQNLEEMQTTQEDLQQQIAENKKVQKELAKEQYLMDALMSNVPDYIYFKDLESKFIKTSTSLARAFGLDKANDSVGKSDFDFFDDEHARPAFDDEQKIIKTGKPILDLVEKEVKKDGAVSWVSTTKLPLRDQDGNIIGTFGISKDITEQKKMEMDIVEKNEALQAQEEELRQNLEEMQTTQEDLQKQMEENKKVQKELAKEQYLMDALMSNVPEYIYFKDLESKFIKSSVSLARNFGLDKAQEIIGKSDFDFFDDEHAKPAYEGEQEIIKTGKPIIDLVEKEVKKDGTVTWASTTKLPLRDLDGNIIGTFGISKDVTEQKKMETDIVEKNEALQAQEEELRQNLEEMQTIQEDLHIRIRENDKQRKEFEKREKQLKKDIERLQNEILKLKSK